MLYKKSDGTEIRIRDMPTPYLMNAIQKARREQKHLILGHLEEEARLRDTPTWQVRATDGQETVAIKAFLTNAEAWQIAKEKNTAEGLTRHSVAHESDPI
jgi:hypothetical protein